MPLLKAVSKLSRPTPRSQNERFRSRHRIQFNNQIKGKIMFKDLEVWGLRVLLASEPGLAAVHEFRI